MVIDSVACFNSVYNFYISIHSNKLDFIDLSLNKRQQMLHMSKYYLICKEINMSSENIIVETVFNNFCIRRKTGLFVYEKQ